LKETPPFASVEALRSRFDNGLQGLLTDYDELGTFILVLANAGFDRALWERLSEPLNNRFQMLAREVGRHRLTGLLLDDAGDDLQVFRKIMALGFDRLSPTEFRRTTSWELQFNQLRSFRPHRLAQSSVNRINIPFDPNSFNFNKPFLRKEIMWQGWLCGRNAALFYNKFPFVDMHALLVPDPRQALPQYLREEDNEYLWHLTEVLSSTLPGIGIGYNSLGACASVNHLHFQMFCRQRPLPVADPSWAHNGGQESYPLACRRFDSVTESRKFIFELHQKEISYNLIYYPGAVYCLPRAKQGSHSQAPWSSGFAWYELAGGFTTFNRGDFNRLDEGALASEMAKLELKE